jgi:hypothetical protein
MVSLLGYLGCGRIFGSMIRTGLKYVPFLKISTQEETDLATNVKATSLFLERTIVLKMTITSW